MTSSADENKMKMINTMTIQMIMIKNDACMSNANIKCRSLTRKNKKINEKGRGLSHTHHTGYTDKNNKNNNSVSK